MFDRLPPKLLVKRILARPYNAVKRWMKTRQRKAARNAPVAAAAVITNHLADGDWVRVRSAEEIQPTLNQWKELKGCAFLDSMWEYCGTEHQVLKVMTRFLDERDYTVKKVRGVVLLKEVYCHGTPVFGRCDRCCHLFWREEWLEKIAPPI